MIFRVFQSKTRTLPLRHKGGGDPSLIRYSSKTAEQNFMKLSGIVHYMMPYCTSYILNFYPHDFGVSQSKTRTLPYKTWGSGGYHFVSIAHSISSLCWKWSHCEYPFISSCIYSMFIKCNVNIFQSNRIFYLNYLSIICICILCKIPQVWNLEWYLL